MKNICYCLIFPIIILTAFTSAHPQGFNSVTTPDGINILAVGNAGKYYRSGNGGVTYSSYTIVGTPVLKSVACYGNDIWFCGQNGNVYKTQKTVSPVSSFNVGSSGTLNSVTFINSNTGFACGDGGGIYKTVNGGINWSSSNSGIGVFKLNSISFRNASNGIVVGNSGKIYVTVDGGSSWTLQSSPVAFNFLKVKYFSDSAVIAGEFGTLLLNSGNGWTAVDTRTNSDIRGIGGIHMNSMHVCGGGGFIRNNKNGNSLFGNFEINPMLANLVDIFFFDSNNGWACSSLNNVIVYTTNGGANWNMPSGAAVSFNWVSKTPSGSGIGNNLCPHPKDRNSMFVVYGNKVYVSRDRSETWTQIATISIGSRAHSFYVSPVDTNIWLAAMESSPDCVVRSTNYGANWTSIIAYDFSTYGQPLEMDQNNPSTFYYAPSNNGSSTGLFKSTDNGATFNLVSLYNQANINQPCDIIVMWDSSSVIYIGDDGADIWKSINGGSTWTLVKPGSSSEIPSMCNSVFDKSICYATTWGGSQVYRTVDFGNSWSVVSNNSGSGWGSDLCREDPSVVLTGNFGSEAYLTTNGGANFFNINTGLSGAGAGMIVPDRGYMLNMQTGNLFKLNITYTDAPVMNNIDVQVLSVGSTGVNYYSSSTIIPSGSVKNNNGVIAATFSVTRTISPGGYSSTKTVSSLAPNTSTNISFDSWTFVAGTIYTIRDSVFISDDTNPVNDVMTGQITPYVGQNASLMNEQFASVFPPVDWTFDYSGTNYWMGSTASAYGIGNGSAKYNFWSSPSGTNQSMLTPIFAVPSTTGDSLRYDYAYMPYSTNYIDSLIIETSTNGGSTFTTLVKLFGYTGASGNFALNTTTSGGNNFVPTAGQWLSKSWLLPAGTNKVKFRARSGYGNNLYLDNIGVSSASLYTQYNIKLAPQGFYNGSTLNMKDSVRANLRSNVSPYNVVDSSIVVLDSVNLTASFVFKNVPTGTYYIQLLHRNSVETWSKSGGEAITKGVTAGYDFTSLQSMSYGSNSIAVGNKWCLFSGEVNSDGSIDLSDIVTIFNDASIFASGYNVTDVNGDGLSDLSDIVIAFNNSSDFVTKVTPETSPTDLQRIKELNKKNLNEYLNNRNTSDTH